MPGMLRKVAIACQRGGSHAACTAGVLQRVLAPDLRRQYELIGLSGTSGGAMCAALAWAGLLGDGPDDAIARLGAFWRDLEARPPFDALGNLWAMWAARLPLSWEADPNTLQPFAERRLSELVNLALAQELFLVKTINDLIAEHPKALAKYKPIEVKYVRLLRALDCASKLNRDPDFIESLMAEGREVGDQFFAPPLGQPLAPATRAATTTAARAGMPPGPLPVTVTSPMPIDNVYLSL